MGIGDFIRGILQRFGIVRRKDPFSERTTLESAQMLSLSEAECLSQENAALGDFLQTLLHVKWFRNLGRDVGSEANVRQIREWKDWAGPEESTGIMADAQQEIYDRLMAKAGEQSVVAQKLWTHIHAVVFRDAAPVVPYDVNEDAWHGPTVAVWHAAWTAGLVGLSLYLRQAIPLHLQDEWGWFLKGHWPCDWEGEFPDGHLIVY